MLIDTHDAVKKLLAANMPEKQAEAITHIISNIDSKVATKDDITRLETKIEIEAKWLKALTLVTIGLLLKIAFF